MCRFYHKEPHWNIYTRPRFCKWNLIFFCSFMTDNLLPKWKCLFSLFSRLVVQISCQVCRMAVETAEHVRHGQNSSWETPKLTDIVTDSQSGPGTGLAWQCRLWSKSAFLIVFLPLRYNWICSSIWSTVSLTTQLYFRAGNEIKLWSVKWKEWNG